MTHAGINTDRMLAIVTQIAAKRTKYYVCLCVHEVYITNINPHVSGYRDVLAKQKGTIAPHITSANLRQGCVK